MSRICSPLNAPLLTQVVCKAHIEQLALYLEINLIAPAKPVLGELCDA